MNPVIAETVDTIATWLSLIVSVGAVVTLFYTFARFTQKPNQTQNDRLDALELWKDKVEDRLLKGNDHFSQIDSDTKVTQKALLALLSHALDGNDVASLKEAKHDLETHLIDK